MTDSDWATVRQWLLHGEGALLSADELVELMRPERLKQLAAELRVNRFVSRHRGMGE
jgi:hypothetical protein